MLRTDQRNNHPARLWLGALALLLCVLAALAWTGYSLSRITDDVSSYEIIHDDYVLRQAWYPEDPEAGLIQQLPKGDGRTLYGFRLMFATKGRVAHGTLFVRLLKGEETAAVSLMDMTELLDGDFVNVIFTEPAVLEEGADYRLSVSFSPVTAEDEAGLVYGEAEQSSAELPLTAGDGTAPARRTAVMQYMNDHTDRAFAWKYLAPIGLLVLAALLIAWLLIFVFHTPLSAPFAVLAVGLGLAWAFVNPPLAGPDEYVHVAGAYSMASRMMGQEEICGNELPMRACDAPYMKDESGKIGPMAYKWVWDGMDSTGNDRALTELAEVRNPGRVHPMQYVAQALGMVMARLLGLGFYPMLLLGRAFSVLAFAAMAAAAIHITPVGKNIFFAAGLLPSCLELAGSVSSDPFIIGTAFLFTAVCLRGICGERPFTVGWQLAAAALAAILAPAKAIYVVMIFLCLLIPEKRLGGKRPCLIFRTGVFVLAAAGWLVLNGGTVWYTLSNMNLLVLFSGLLALAVLAVSARSAWKRWSGRPGFGRGLCIAAVVLLILAGAAAVLVLPHIGLRLSPEELLASIQPNGDSIYRFNPAYILGNIPQTVKLLIDTLLTDLPLYLQGVLGTIPGEHIVYGLELSWTTGIALLTVLLLSVMRPVNQPCRLTKSVRWTSLSLFVLAALLMLAACLSWTPVNYATVFGIQGRYLLPVLPLLLFWLGDCRLVALRGDHEKGLCLAGGILSAVALLESLIVFAA